MRQPCLCRTYPGCRNQPEPGERLCSICRGEHHRTYTERQMAAATKRKEQRA